MSFTQEKVPAKVGPASLLPIPQILREILFRLQVCYQNYCKHTSCLQSCISQAFFLLVQEKQELGWQIRYGQSFVYPSGVCSQTQHLMAVGYLQR